MDNSITPAANGNRKTRRDLTEILARLRDMEITRVLSKLSDRVDQHMMLSLLDLAEWRQQLAVFPGGRAMASATGVEKKYADASLRRLSTVKSPEGGTRLVNMNARHHPRQAETYYINPACPLVASIDRGLAGSLRDAAATIPVAVADETHTLFRFFENPGMTPSHAEMMAPSNLGRSTPLGVTRRGMLIGRTSLGVALGKPAVAVYLTLDDGWQPIREIAEKTGMTRDYAYRLLSRILAPMGLARSDSGEFIRQGTRQMWRIGMPIEECHPENLPDAVGARMRRWEAEQADRKLRYPVTEEEYVAAEITALRECVS
jgi:hypothetical protein